MLCFCLLASACLVAVHATAKKPHVIFILADDYGWGNLGYHRRGQVSSEDEKQGQAEVHTPVLDSLIDDGILLDRHYTYRICSPSRSSLQSGRLAVHVNPLNTGVTSQNYNDPVSGYAGIPRNMTGLAEKMREGGYRTHMVGKWDAGMATPEHTPKGRGYESWLGYYQHANEYWRKNTVLQATGEIDPCLNKMTDFSMHNESYSGGVREASWLSGSCQDSPEKEPSCYEEFLFKERALKVINLHDLSQSDNPLFLFYAFHLLHTPLQVPSFWLEEIDRRVKQAGGKPFSSENRRLYAAMTLYMDSAVGEVVAALKKRGMYEDTLIVFAADNGGPIYIPGSASNHPLKGAKYSDWEGGIRTNAFISGGFVPMERRGSTFEGVISVADWYGTLLEFAGVEAFDRRAEAANAWLREHNLPLLAPVDSVSQWNFILNNTNARPSALHLSEQAVLQWPFKLITGKQVYSTWTGPVYPNCSTIKGYEDSQGPLFVESLIFGERMQITRTPEQFDLETWTRDCGTGCLFNIKDDPTEHLDLASDAAYASILSNLQKTLQTLNKDLFKPDRGTARVEGCKVAIDNGRFLGPFVDIDGFYSPPPVRSLAQKIADSALLHTLSLLNSESVKNAIIKSVNAVAPSTTKLFASDKCISGETSESSRHYASILAAISTEEMTTKAKASSFQV